MLWNGGYVLGLSWEFDGFFVVHCNTWAYGSGMLKVSIPEKTRKVFFMEHRNTGLSNLWGLRTGVIHHAL